MSTIFHYSNGMKQEHKEAVHQQHDQNLYEHQSRKRSREEYTTRDSESHKDGAKGVWQQTSQEHPTQTTSDNSPQPWNQSQRASLPNPEVSNVDSAKPSDDPPTNRLPSIKHLQLDPSALARARRWEHYGANNPISTPSQHTFTFTTPHPSPTLKSPLKITQSIAPPSPPATELVPVKTNNNYGFIETTFTNVPAKKAHRRRPANIDKGSLFCHTCGSKNTPEWRRGPQGPATLCNACGLAYAKRLRQEEENSTPVQAVRPDPPLSPRLSSYIPEPPPPPTAPVQVAQYPTLALSELYQPGLFHNYQQPYEHVTDHTSAMNSFAWNPLTYSPRPTFRSAHNRPNGHTFHEYTPPVPVVPPSRSPSFLAYPANNSAHLPLTTTTTTTTTTSLFPFGISPTDIPVVPPSEPPNFDHASAPPVTATLSASNTLPILTTLSTSTNDDVGYPALNRYPSLSYRTLPNVPPPHPTTLTSSSVAPASVTPASNASQPGYPYISTFPGPALSTIYTPSPYPSSLSPGTSSTPSSPYFPTLYMSTPYAPAPTTTPSTASMSSTPSVMSSTPPASPIVASSSASSTPSSTSHTPSPSQSPARSSPSSSPSSIASSSSSISSRSHSPTLTPITTIAALSNGASPPNE